MWSPQLQRFFYSSKGQCALGSVSWLLFSVRGLLLQKVWSDQEVLSILSAGEGFLRYLESTAAQKQASALKTSEKFLSSVLLLDADEGMWWTVTVLHMPHPYIVSVHSAGAPPSTKCLSKLVCISHSHRFLQKKWAFFLQKWPAEYLSSHSLLHTNNLKRNSGEVHDDFGGERNVSRSNFWHRKA